VTVTTQKDDIPMFFMQVFGAQPASLTASSIAVMDWAGALHQGAGFVLALKADCAKTGDLKIYLNPDQDDRGWYAKDPEKTNANMIKGYLDNPGTIPAIQKGDLINLEQRRDRDRPGPDCRQLSQQDRVAAGGEHRRL
jgi:hypothetical protein